MSEQWGEQKKRGDEICFTLDLINLSCRITYVVRAYNILYIYYSRLHKF